MKQNKIPAGFTRAKQMPIDTQWLASNRARLTRYVKMQPMKGLSRQAAPTGSIFHLLFITLKPMIPAILILAVLFGGGGAVVAAQNDLPGDTLYSVKIATENVKEALTFSTEKKAEAKTEAATHRAEELVALTKRDGTLPSQEVVTEATARFQKLLKEIGELTAQLTPEEKLALAPQISMLASSSLSNWHEVRIAGTTSTHATIDDAVQSVLRTELTMSEDEESAVKGQPSLTGLQHRAENKINEVTHKIAETKKELAKKTTVSSTAALLVEAETALKDAQTSFAAGAYAEAFLRAGDAQQAIIKVKQSLENSNEAEDNDNENDVRSSDKRQNEIKSEEQKNKDEAKYEDQKNQDEEQKHEAEKLREASQKNEVEN